MPLIASTVLLGGNAFALPFQPNAASFTKYLNSQTWKDGKTRRFQNLSSCEEKRRTDGSKEWGDLTYKTWYRCNVGYVTITSPMGRVFCELTDFNRYAVYYHNYRYIVRGTDNETREVDVDVKTGTPYNCQSR